MSRIQKTRKNPGFDQPIPCTGGKEGGGKKNTEWNKSSKVVKGGTPVSWTLWVEKNWTESAHPIRGFLRRERTIKGGEVEGTGGYVEFFKDRKVEKDEVRKDGEE